MQAIEILKAGRDRILDSEHWTQKYYAKNAENEEVFLRDKSATCWCSLGALIVSTDSDDARQYLIARKALEAEMHPTIIKFNDTHRHDEVITAWDIAIEKLENPK